MSRDKHLNLKMTGDTKGVEASLARTEAMLAKLKSQTAGLRTGMGAIVGGADPFSTIKGSLTNLIGEIPYIGPQLQGAALAAESAYRKIAEVQKEILTQGKAAAASGSSMEGYSALLFAAGGDAEVLNTALFKTSKSIADAALGGGELDDTLSELGLSSKELSGQLSDQQFLRLVGALSKVENLSERNAIAFKIWGKSAKEVMGLAALGPEGLERKFRLAEKRGVILTEEDLATIKQAKIAMDELELSGEGFWRRLSVASAPGLKAAADDLSAFGDALQEIVGGGFWERFAGGLVFLEKILAKKGKAGVTFGISDIEAAMQETNDFLFAFDRKTEQMAAKKRKDQADLQRQLKDTEVAKASGEEEKAAMEYFRESNRILKEIQTPAEKYADALGKINEELEKGTIFEKEAARARENARDALLKSVPGALGDYDALIEKAKQLEGLKDTLSPDELARGFGKLLSLQEQATEKTPELIERGSARDFSVRSAYERPGTSAQERVAHAIEQLRLSQQEQTEIGRAIKDFLERQIGVGKL